MQLEISSTELQISTFLLQISVIQLKISAIIADIFNSGLNVKTACHTCVKFGDFFADKRRQIDTHRITHRRGHSLYSRGSDYRRRE